MRETILADKIVQREIYVSTLLSLLLMKFFILKKKKKKTCKTSWKGLLPKLLHLQDLYNQTNHFLIVACHLLDLIVRINHTCCQIGDFSIIFLQIASAFVPMPCFIQSRIEGTNLDFPITNIIYVSVVKLKIFSAQLSIGLSKLSS